MVRAICYTLAAVALCAALFVFTEWYVGKQFKEFYDAVEVLYEKVDDETANREDGFAVRTLWNSKKEKLHVFLPHNDISYVDYWLSEACGLIYNRRYELALGKLEVLKEIARNLPDAYRLKLENIF